MLVRRCVAAPVKTLWVLVAFVKVTST